VELVANLQIDASQIAILVIAIKLVAALMIAILLIACSQIAILRLKLCSLSSKLLQHATGNNEDGCEEKFVQPLQEWAVPQGK
jgi:hypothetical protein